MAGSRYRTNYTIKTIWGLAKSPELGLDDDMLHDLVYRETKKESIKKLTKAEIDKVCTALIRMKGSTKSGNTATSDQRKKIDRLVEGLGWKDNPNRLNGFVKKMFQVDRVEWLNHAQCSKLIEALKKMAARQAEQKVEENG